MHIALSPNHCLAIGVDADGDPKLKVMEYTLGSLDAQDGDRMSTNFQNVPFLNCLESDFFAAKVTSTVIALALQFAISCTNHLNNDDLATVIQQCLSPRKLP